MAGEYALDHRLKEQVPPPKHALADRLEHSAWTQTIIFFYISEIRYFKIEYISRVHLISFYIDELFTV